jgi:hypothetical protein
MKAKLSPLRSNDSLDAAVNEIVERLFTNGAKETARRLVLELENGRNGGGWGKEPVRDLILDVLKKRSV